MSAYIPNAPFNVPMYLLTPTTFKVKGVQTKKYLETGDLFFGSFRTFGGTEQTVNGVYSIVDTATIETWYRPDIKAGCRVKLEGKVYEVIGTPENINMRNQYLKFKVQAVTGGA